MQALSIIDFPAEPHLLPVMVKVKKILAERPSRTCLETRVSQVSTHMVCGHKTTTMMMIIPNNTIAKI